MIPFSPASPARKGNSLHDEKPRDRESHGLSEATPQLSTIQAACTRSSTLTESSFCSVLHIMKLAHEIHGLAGFW